MTTSTALPPKRFTNVHGLRLAHVEMGSGDPIVVKNSGGGLYTTPDGADDWQWTLY